MVKAGAGGSVNVSMYFEGSIGSSPVDAGEDMRDLEGMRVAEKVKGVVEQRLM